MSFQQIEKLDKLQNLPLVMYEDSMQILIASDK